MLGGWESSAHVTFSSLLGARALLFVLFSVRARLSLFSTRCAEFLVVGYVYKDYIKKRKKGEVIFEF